MSGRFAIAGLTALAFLAFGMGLSSVPSSATAEFRIPGLFSGKPAAKRKRYRARKPVQPNRNPDRVTATVSAKAVSPDVAKNSAASLGVGASSAASVALAIPAPIRMAAKEPDEDAAPDTGAAETASAETEPDGVKTAETKSTETDATDETAAKADAAGTETDRSDTAERQDADKADATASDETDAEPESKAAASDRDDDKNETAAADSKPAESDSAAGDETDASEDTAVAHKADTEAEDKKSADTKTADTKTADAKDEETEDDETKAAEAESSDTKSADAKSTDDVKSAEAKPADDAKTTDDVKSAADDTDDTPPAPKTAEAKDEDTEPADAEAADADDADKKVAENDAGEEQPAEEEVADVAENDSDTAETKTSETARDETEMSDTETSDKDAADTKTAEAAGDAEATDEADSTAKTELAEASEETPSGKADDAGDAVEAAEAAPKAEPMPPAPDPKPEAARLASKTDDAKTDDAKSETEAKPGTGSDAEPDAKAEAGTMSGSEVTASISPAGSDGSGQSVEAADVTDVARAAADAPAEEASAPDPRAYDATVVLDVSPPPGAEQPDADGTKIAALDPGAAPASGDDAASGGEAAEDDTVDLGPPPPPPVDPVIATVRSKLERPSAPDVAQPDLDALKALYGERDDAPLWLDDGALSAKAKALIATFGDADDWGLDSTAYKVPDADAALATDEARADAELALSAAVLRYARHAQTGRLTPSRAHKLFDYNPTARDPKTVLTEIAASETPDKSLLALHPQGAQYQQLHTALVHARDTAKSLGRDPNTDRHVQLIVINMERWRWLPSNLGSFHVWNNIPEFYFRVFKGGREIYREKSIVGEVKYATPFFSAPMRNIVFNPNWTVPPTIVKEDIAPKLKGPQRSGGLFGGRESRNRMLRRYGLTVSKGGEPVDADAVDWQSANVHSYTFTQDPGPHNVLGQFKFNFPNKHAIYMHDTTQKELFARSTRTLSHGCIRVNQPARFAALLLGEDKGWSMGTVQDTLARAQGQTKVIALNKKIPVHLTYNTAVADGSGSVREYTDVYGIDSRMAAKLFKKPAHFNVPYSADFAETSPVPQYSDPRPRRRRSANPVDEILSGLLGN